MTRKSSVALIHYTSPPVVGGVEAVMVAHARVLRSSGFAVTLFSGRGSEDFLPSGVDFVKLPLMDSQHPRIRELNLELEKGIIPEEFESITAELKDSLEGLLVKFDHVIVHNIFTKHFNLPLTAALSSLVDQNVLNNCIAWCHDFTWTSDNSRHKVHDNYPWDLLKTCNPDITHVTVSKIRQQDLAELFGIPAEEVHVVYNGVDIEELLGLSLEGLSLMNRIGYLESNLNLLMPVRITRAKNLEFAFRTSAALHALGCPNKLVVTRPPDPHSASNMDYYSSLKELRSELNLEEHIFFVYEEGTDSHEPYTISMEVIGDLYRASDALLMPSHREGFGMPVLEAGLVGLPVFCTPIPAALEIGGENMFWIDPDAGPDEAARTILSWCEQDKPSRMRRLTRRKFTWGAIFKNDILPLLQG